VTAYRNERARRLVPKRSLSSRSAADGGWNVPGRLRAGEEVDVDARDPVRAELDVAGAGARVTRGRLQAAQARHHVGRDGARRGLGEHAGLRRAGVGEVADRVDAGERRLERGGSIVTQPSS
jgi:hypothetical protein